LVIAPDKLIDACRFLRDDPALKFAMLADLTAVDWLPTDREPRFQVVYHLLSLEHNRRLRLKIDVAEDDATAPSVTDIWPTANFFEREVYDLFGIRFAGHPDLRRILMPDDWLTYPLRKDVPLGEEDVDFSHNQQPAEP
jgi:NADH-quinone oxidoreductase subunit C